MTLSYLRPTLRASQVLVLCFPIGLETEGIMESVNCTLNAANAELDYVPRSLRRSSLVQPEGIKVLMPCKEKSIGDWSQQINPSPFLPQERDSA